MADGDRLSELADQGRYEFDGPPRARITVYPQQSELDVTPPSPEFLAALEAAANRDRGDRLMPQATVPGMDMSDLARMGGAAATRLAPSAYSLARGEPAPPIANLPEYGKVPSTDDPRYAGAAAEAGELAQNFLPMGGAEKVAATVIPPLLGVGRRVPKIMGEMAAQDVMPQAMRPMVRRPQPQGYRAANENIGAEGPTALDAARLEGYGQGEATGSGKRGEAYLTELISELGKEKGIAPLRAVPADKQPMRRQDAVRDPSGRPIMTARLPIGTEQAILDRGYETATGARPAGPPPPLMQAAARMGDLAELPRSQWYHGISANKLPRPLSEMQAERVVTQPVREKIITPESLQGSVLLPAIGDRSMANARLLGVGGQRLEIPTELQGGRDYMQSKIDPYVWASDKGVISTMANRAKALQEKFGTDVYAPYTPMSPPAVDFSHHMTDTLAEMVKNSKILKTSKKMESAQSFDEAMRGPAKGFGATPDFPGINSPNLREYLINEASGKDRNKFAKLMEAAPYQKSGFPSVAEARFATIEPGLLNEPTFSSGLSISRIAPNIIGPSGHRTYNTGIGGTYIGGLGYSVPRDIMYPDIFRALNKRGLEPSQVDYAFRMGADPHYQVANQRWLDNFMRYREMLKQRQP